MTSLKYIIKDMFTNRTRLILTVLAVAWGTFSIALMLSVGEGLRFTFGGVVKNTGQEALIVRSGFSTLPFKGQANNIIVNFDEYDLALLQKALSKAALVTGIADWNAAVAYQKNAFGGPPITAVQAQYGKIHAINLMPLGRFINEEDLKRHRHVIVLGNRSAQKLFKHGENPLGKFVRVANRPFIVIGVQGKSLRVFSSNRMPDEFTNWVPYTTYQDLTLQKNFSTFVIAPYHLADVPRLQKEIRRMIANRRQLNPNDPGIVDFINLQEQKQKLNLFLLGIEILLGMIGCMTLVVAGVGIANVMFISVKRGTREIGIKMALGAKSHTILAYYALEALLTTITGGTLGLLLTESVLLLLNHIPMNSTLLQYLGNPKPILSFNVILIVISTLGTIGCLAGLFPAFKAASINPAEALRYEQ